MPVLTAAITALGLAGVSAAHNASYAGREAVATPRTYSEDFTRLGVGGTALSPNDDYAKPVAPVGSRSGGPWTALAPYGTVKSPHASFAGKSEQTFLEKAASFSIVPVVTVGEFSSIDVDITATIIPRVALSATVTRALSANFTVRPVLTQARGQVNSTGTTPKAAGLTVKPVLTLSSNVREIIASSLSVVPVVSLTATVYDAGKFATHSVIPVVTINAGVNRVNASQAWNVPMVVRPVARMTSSVAAFGEVDRINFTATPKGRIRITKV